MELIFGLVSLLFSLLPLAVIILVAVTLVRAAARARPTGQRPPAPKARTRLDPASRTIRRAEARMDSLDAWHAGEDCTFSYSTRDPSFSFNGRQVVDELAELRRKNEAHERHLLARVHRD